MINFTEENFSLDRFLELKALINKAQFVALDCEFTSVSGNKHDAFTFSQNDVYLKKKRIVEDSVLTQLGASFFIKKENSEFDVYSYNFYVGRNKRSR